MNSTLPELRLHVAGILLLSIALGVTVIAAQTPVRPIPGPAHSTDRATIAAQLQRGLEMEESAVSLLTSDRSQDSLQQAYIIVENGYRQVRSGHSGIGLAVASYERRFGFKDPLLEVHMRTLETARSHILRAMDDIARGTTGRTNENVTAAIQNLTTAIHLIRQVLTTGL